MRQIVSLVLCYLTVLSTLLRAEDKLLIVDAISLTSPKQMQSFQSKVLSAILEEYQGSYELLIVPRNRARQIVTSHTTACSPWMLKSELRELKFNFTLPYTMESSLKLVLSKESDWGKKLIDYQNNQPISLAELLKGNKTPIIGIESERSYGSITDALLEQFKHSDSIYLRTSSSDSLAQLQPMLLHGYIDIMIEYKKIKDTGSHSLYYLDYKETEPFQLVYFACSKSEQVNTVIKKLNSAIYKLSQTPEYQSLILNHLPMIDRENAKKYWLLQLNSGSKQVSDRVHGPYIFR